MKFDKPLPKTTNHTISTGSDYIFISSSILGFYFSKTYSKSNYYAIYYTTWVEIYECRLIAHKILFVP